MSMQSFHRKFKKHERKIFIIIFVMIAATFGIGDTLLNKSQKKQNLYATVMGQEIDIAAFQSFSNRWQKSGLLINYLIETGADEEPKDKTELTEEVMTCYLIAKKAGITVSEKEVA